MVDVPFPCDGNAIRPVRYLPTELQPDPQIGNLLREEKCGLQEKHLMQAKDRRGFYKQQCKFRVRTRP